MAPQNVIEDSAGPHYISKGRLPPPELVTELVREVHQRFKSNTDGENSTVYPALARVSKDLFAICVASTSGGKRQPRPSR